MLTKIYNSLTLTLDKLSVHGDIRDMILEYFEDYLDKLRQDEMIDLYVDDCNFQIRELANDMVFEQDQALRSNSRDEIIRQQVLDRIYRKYQDKFPLEKFSWDNATNSGLVEPWESRILGMPDSNQVLGIKAPPEKGEADITQKEIGQSDLLE